MDSDEGTDIYGSDNEPTSRFLEQWESNGPVVTSKTSFDAYFLQASSRARTSTNVFSSRVLPLTAEEYTETISAYKERPEARPLQTRWAGPLDETTAFRRYARELAEGFNLLFYGFGSKRTVLNKFATELLSKRGHVVVVNGFQPATTLKDILSSIERVPGVQSMHLSSMNAEQQTQRIYDYFADESSSNSRSRHLYLVVHNIDSPAMRSPKIKNVLSLLALNPNIHLVASVDRPNAPLLWSSSEILARKLPASSPQAKKNIVPKRGYSWLWHDLTTLAPYDFELTFADRSSISGASALTNGGRLARQDLAAGLTGGPLTESAVTHVLAAVTAKAKKLFALLGAKQIENMEAAGDSASSSDLKQHGLTYDALFSAARDAFVATSDTALRSLLGEFRDHGLVLSAAQGGPGSGETLWVPLRRERLAKILQSIDTE